MLHTVLSLERPLIIFDLETTGLNTSEARIVEIGFQRFTAMGLEKEWRSVINPGVPIPAELTAIHGVSNESFTLCRDCGRNVEAHRQPPVGTLTDPTRECEGYKPWPTFQQIAANLAKGFSDCDFGGKNVRYDLRVMSSEMQRAGVEWHYLHARVIDAERLEQLGEPRHLSNLYEKHTGKRLENAHHALVDVRASTEVIVAQLKKYQQLPRNLDLLHKLQWPGMLDEGGKFKMKNGVATCCFGKHIDKPMSAIPSDYWDWLLSADFPADVKALAMDAKLGKYPTGGE